MDPIAILVEQVTAIWRGTIEATPQIIIALMIVLITFGTARLARTVVRRTLRRAGLRQSLKNLFELFAAMAVWLLGLMLAALVAFPNLTPTKLLAALGVGSVAIGFAFKDVFENLLAGIIILMRREMRIGDYIQCGEIEGTVEDIQVRETHIRCNDDQLVIVPNSHLFMNPLWILTDRDQRRIRLICGVAYGENLDLARDVIRDAVGGCQTVRTDQHAIQVFANEFADSSVNFEITWWTGSRPVDERQSRDEVLRAIKSALNEADIEIPFPHRTLTFPEPLSLQQSGGD